MAAGAALAGPLAGRSVTGCLLVAAVIELSAAAAYLLTGVCWPGSDPKSPFGITDPAGNTTDRSE